MPNGNEWLDRAAVDLAAELSTPNAPGPKPQAVKKGETSLLVQVTKSRPPRPTGAKPVQIWVSPELDDRLSKAIAGQRNNGVVALVEYALAKLEAEGEMLVI